MRPETLCIHGGYRPGNGEPSALPIFQSTTFKYNSTAEIAALFDLKESGFFYSRLGNPTCDSVERKLAALEGGSGALLTSSGQAALLCAVLTLAHEGDHLLCSASVYGGTFNLLAVTLKRLGISTDFFDQRAPDEELSKFITPRTRLILGETLANPALTVFDIARFAALAHRHHLPLLVDNTFATPILCRPIEYGADIVTHSTTKYLDGHGIQVGGAIIDSGRRDWQLGGKFPEFTTPDPSYHGLVYSEAFGAQAFIVKARAQMMRDLGACQSAQGAFYLNLGIETLPLRIRQHSQNAQALAEFFAKAPQVEKVCYPGLPDSPDHELARRYLPEGTSGVLSIILKGGRRAGAAFIDHVKLAYPEVHVADIRTCVLHPASSTHRQLSEDQLMQAGISPGLIRISAGLEHIDDLLEDFSAALKAAS